MTRLLVAALVLLAGSTAQADDAATALVDVLPEPRSAAKGEVPFSEPIAPVPPGEAPWQIALGAMGGVADPFYGKAAVQLSARRGFGAFAIEAMGGRAFSWEGPAFGLCSRPGTCTSPSSTQLAAVPGQLEWMASLGGVWQAARGKASVAGLSAFPFFIELGAGAAAVSYVLRAGGDSTAWGPGGRLALGVGADIGSQLSLRLELSQLLYRTDIRGDVSLEGQTFAGAMLSWFPGGGR